MVAAVELEKGAFPGVGEDGGVEEPEAIPVVDEEAGIAIRVLGGVGEEEAGAPESAATGESGTLDADVVGFALTGAVEPTDEEVTAPGFHEAGGVIVPVFRGEDEFRAQEGGFRSVR
jgi:hypothetical protein